MEKKVLFSELGLSEESLYAINKKGFESPTKIQSAIIPLFLNLKEDLIGQADTGTGKTAAFGLPLLDMIDKGGKYTQAIIMVPTRELAIQVYKEMKDFNIKHNVSMTLCYGGQSMYNEKRELKNNPQIVIGTPGRMIDHTKKKLLDLSNIRFFVLDEADEMLNIGFREDIEFMMSKSPENKRVLLFSATMPKAILDIVNKYMKDYKKISVQNESKVSINIDQKWIEIDKRHKFDALCRLIEIEQEFYGIIFCRTKVDVDKVNGMLKKMGFMVEAIHGDIDQRRRERVLSDFRRGRIKILVATDVAARGIDVSDLTHVINFSLPENPEIYTHRIGRTGRAGKTGKAISLVERSEMRKIFFIERIIKHKIQKSKLPGNEEFIKVKKEKILSEIKNIIEIGNLDKFSAITEELLKLGEAKNIISALLKHRYQNDLNPKVIPVSISKGFSNNSDEIRIFIAKGRNQGYGVSEIIDLIRKEVNVNSNKVQSIKILDNFSYATLPFAEGDALIHLYKKKAKGGRPMIVKAKPFKRR